MIAIYYCPWHAEYSARLRAYLVSPLYESIYREELTVNSWLDVTTQLLHCDFLDTIFFLILRGIRFRES